MSKKLKIVYLYNRPGWAFEFEARHYQKHSRFEIIPTLETDIDNISPDIDIVVLPSCLHYELVINQKILHTFKRKNIKFVVQCNSHKETDYYCPGADLIIASSPKLYQILKKKYSYKNLICQPHFVDTEFFKSKNTYNNFTVGWAGDVKNPFKRSHLLKSLNCKVSVKSDMVKSQQQNTLQHDMPDFYNQLDVLLILSESEGTPMPLLEAMSCGKIVISTDVGLTKDVLLPFYVIRETQDDKIIQQFNAKLSYLKQHPEVIKKTGMRNKQIVEKYFSWSSQVNKLDSIYATLAKKEVKKPSLQFVSPEPGHSYLEELKKHVNITFNKNLKEVKETNRPVILWNPYGYMVAPKLHWKRDLYIDRVANKKPTYILERGALPSALFLDKQGFLADSHTYDSYYWDYPLKSYQEQLVDYYIQDFKTSANTLEPQGSERQTRQEFYNKLQLPENKKIVFIPMQVYKDTSIQLYSDWIGKYENFVNLVQQLAMENRDTIFLVKNHPVERNHKVTAQSNIKIADDCHYKDCIAYCDLVLTVNSSVGLQAMMWEKPVITLGKTFYNFENINYSAKTKEQISALLKTAQSPNMDKVRRFIYYLRFEFYIYCEMQKTGNNASKPLKMKNVIYQNSTSDDLLGNLEPYEIIPKERLLNQEKISVLIPVFNREKLIEESLESILNQTYKNLEIIIYDDGSTDSTVQKIRTYMEKDKRIKLILGKTNVGVASARNVLLDVCQTRYAVWHDSDDMSHHSRIELQYKEMQKKDRMIFGSWDNLSYHLGEWKISVQTQKTGKRPRGYATLMFPVNKTITFDPDKKLGGEDWDWIERMLKYYDSVEISERVYYVNFHQDKIGRWKLVLRSFKGIDMTKMSYKEMQDFYREKTGKDLKD